MADESLSEIAASFRVAARDVMPKAREIIKRGAVNIKQQMRADASGHRHFPMLARSITFDMTGNQFFAEAEIGPGRGVLAGIAYFGSSRPGGKTVPDPRLAAEAEMPTVERLIGDLAQQAVSGP